MKRDKFYICECGSEILHARYDEDFEEIQLAFFQYGTFVPKPTIWQRIKYCIWHLRTGRIHTDAILLSLRDANMFADWLFDVTTAKSINLKNSKNET